MPYSVALKPPNCIAAAIVTTQAAMMKTITNEMPRQATTLRQAREY